MIKMINLDVNKLFKQYVPIFIVIGVVILLATYLGPIGIVIVILAIGAIAYLIKKYLKSS